MTSRNRIAPVFFWLLPFVPLSWAIESMTEYRTLAFLSAILSIIALARIIGFSTREITLQTNPAFGGLINATFGNAVELTISILAIARGLDVVVQASIIGSILGNILLMTGLSIFVGGLRYKEQTFNKDSVGVSSTMLIIAVVGLTIPTVYSATTTSTPGQVRVLGDAVGIVMAAIYVAGLVFAFFTHKHLFDASDEMRTAGGTPRLGRISVILILLVSTLIVAVESEILVRHVEDAARTVGLTQTFIGVVVIAIITNIAETANSIQFALEDRLDVALEIGLSSAIQIALFVVPVLLFISHAAGYEFSLVFTTFQVVAVVFAVMIVNHLSADGRCNWLEGAQLMSVYAIIAIAFYFV